MGSIALSRCRQFQRLRTQHSQRPPIRLGSVSSCPRGRPVRLSIGFGERQRERCKRQRCARAHHAWRRCYADVRPTNLPPYAENKSPRTPCRPGNWPPLSVRPRIDQEEHVDISIIAIPVGQRQWLRAPDGSMEPAPCAALHPVHWVSRRRSTCWMLVGTGSLSFCLADDPEVCGVHGIDLSPDYIAYAKQKNEDNRPTFQVGDACSLPFPDTSFDHALSMLVLQFVPRSDVALREMCSFTRRGGAHSCRHMGFTRWARCATHHSRHSGCA